MFTIWLDLIGQKRQLELNCCSVCLYLCASHPNLVQTTAEETIRTESNKRRQRKEHKKTNSRQKSKRLEVVFSSKKTRFCIINFLKRRNDLDFTFDAKQRNQLQPVRRRITSAATSSKPSWQAALIVPTSNKPVADLQRHSFHIFTLLGRHNILPRGKL